MATKEIVCEVPAERVEFMLELLRSLDSVWDARSQPVRKRKVAHEMDTTEYLLSSKANAEHLRRSMAQLERGEIVRVIIP